MAVSHWTLKDMIAETDHTKYCTHCRAFTEMVFQAVKGGVFSGLVQANCSRCNRPVTLIKPKQPA